MSVECNNPLFNLVHCHKQTVNKTARPLFPLILLTALIAGFTDGTAAIIQYLVQGGTKPQSVFKYIASALIGKKAFSGGNEMVALGVALHFLIAFLFTAFYFLIYPRSRWLQQNLILSAITYGLFVWAVMNLLVVRLSQIPARAFDWNKALVAMLILILCIGLPVALMARKYYLYKK